MNIVAENIFIDLWKRYWKVMAPFQIEFEHGYSVLIIPRWSNGDLVEIIDEDDDVEFVSGKTSFEAIMSHPEEAPFTVEGDSKVQYISCDDNGELYVKDEDRNAFIEDVKRIIKTDRASLYRNRQFEWRKLSIIWNVAGRDNGPVSYKHINQTATLKFILYGFYNILQKALWGDASSSSISTLEEAVQIEHCMRDNIRSTFSKVTDKHLETISEIDAIMAKLKLTNLLLKIRNLYYSLKMEEFLAEFPFMEKLLNEFAEYFIKPLRETHVDWDVCLSMTNEEITSDEDFIKKYLLIKSGPKIVLEEKNGEITVEPRREFAINYPLIVGLQSIDYLRSLFANYVDELKELPALRLNDIIFSDYRIANAKKKYIGGKYIDALSGHMFRRGELALFITLAMKTLPVNKLPELSESPFDNDNGQFFSICSLMLKIFHVMVFRCHNNFDDMNTLKERLLGIMPDMSDDDAAKYPKSEKEIHIFSSVVAYHDVFSDLLKRYGSYKNIYKKIGNIVGCGDSWIPEGGGHSDNFILNEIEHDLSDVIHGMFYTKVVLPAIFHFAGKKNSNVINDWHEMRNIEHIALMAANDILFFNRFPLIEMLSMTKHVHDRPKRFLDAGNNPESLKEALIDCTDNVDVQSEINAILEQNNISINQDEYRQKFGLDDASWFSLFDSTIKTEKGNLIVPILTSSEMKKEGEAMDNCVGWGGYSESSRKGEINIFSVRNPDGGRLATLEISMIASEEGIEISIDQLRGYSNASLENELREDIHNAINALKDDFAKNDVKANSLGQYIELSDSLSDELSPVEEAGYGFHDYDSLKAAFEPWIPYLPNCIKTPEDFLKVPSFRKIVDEVQAI